MLIDWFTVAAQAVNFLVLVWLLKRFLYRPVLQAMENRERHIRERLEEARTARESALAEQQAFQERNTRFDAERADLLRKAREEVDAQARLWLQDARTDADGAAHRWHRALREEQESFRIALRERLAHETCTLARQALAELADTRLEELIIRRFIQQASENPDRLAPLQNGPLTVKTASPLTESDQDRLRNALQEQLRLHGPFTFETQPDLLAGIEIARDGVKVAWSLDSLADSLEEAVLRQIETVPQQTEDNNNNNDKESAGEEHT